MRKKYSWLLALLPGVVLLGALLWAVQPSPSVWNVTVARYDAETGRAEVNDIWAGDQAPGVSQYVLYLKPKGTLKTVSGQTVPTAELVPGDILDVTAMGTTQSFQYAPVAGGVCEDPLHPPARQEIEKGRQRPPGAAAGTKQKAPRQSLGALFIRRFRTRGD